jgi:hypothetical protein
MVDDIRRLSNTSIVIIGVRCSVASARAERVQERGGTSVGKTVTVTMTMTMTVTVTVTVRMTLTVIVRYSDSDSDLVEWSTSSTDGNFAHLGQSISLTNYPCLFLLLVEKAIFRIATGIRKDAIIASIISFFIAFSLPTLKIENGETHQLS